MALVRRVAERRRAAQQFDAQVSEARAEFEAHYEPLLDAQKGAKALLADAEAELRALAEATYRQTGAKDPAPGVGVRVTQVLVYEEAEALAWAKRTGMALVPESVDRKAFEKIAKASKLGFVRYEEKPTITLASDLDAALAVSDVTAPAEPILPPKPEIEVPF